MIECPICETEKPTSSFNRLYTEPVRRPDGMFLRIMVWHPNHDVEFLVGNSPKIGGTGQWYKFDEVLLLGNNNFHSGINVIGEGVFHEPTEDMSSGNGRLFNSELSKKNNNSSQNN